MLKIDDAKKSHQRYLRAGIRVQTKHRCCMREAQRLCWEAELSLRGVITCPRGVTRNRQYRNAQTPLRNAQNGSLTTSNLLRDVLVKTNSPFKAARTDMAQMLRKMANIEKATWDRRHEDCQGMLVREVTYRPFLQHRTNTAEFAALLKKDSADFKQSLEVEECSESGVYLWQRPISQFHGHSSSQNWTLVSLPDCRLSFLKLVRGLSAFERLNSRKLESESQDEILQQSQQQKVISILAK